MKTTGYLVKASLEKYKYLLSLVISKEPLNLVEFGVVSKPLKYRKPSKKKTMKLKPGDFLFIIEDIVEKDIKKHEKIFVAGEFCQCEELKLAQRKKEVFLDEIDQVPDNIFLQKLFRSACNMPEDQNNENQATENLTQES
jgi:hypothetical protein